MSRNKYALYEEAVQSPERDIPWLVSVYQQTFNREPRVLREDFCGTFKLASEWVKQDSRNHAICLDLDPEPLAYGKRKNSARGLKAMRKNVLSVTSPKADVIIAFNFSFFIFKTREALVEYFRYCRRSLKRQGMLMLEMAGGPGMIQKTKETKTIYSHGGKPKFTYVWEQKSFNPINHEAHYAIHFRFPGGKMHKDAFTYDWRIWTIPEVRDALRDAGFQESGAYWEFLHKRDRTTEFLRSEEGDNDWSWLAFVAGIKR